PGIDREELPDKPAFLRIVAIQGHHVHADVALGGFGGGLGDGLLGLKGVKFSTEGSKLVVTSGAGG
ncbi:hypothetical protein LCGC14_2997960, partial [marine sediment metagenome]